MTTPIDYRSNRMSNIEPTVTRTMRCPTCSVVGIHTIDASMRNETVLCPACAESGKRSVCVVVMPIEPTEEQKQAAYALCKQSTFVYSNDGVVFRAMLNVADVAQLLAEREAKLREEWKRQAATNFGFAATLDKEVTALREEVARLEALCTEEARLIVERDTLRARVAELEAEVSESTRLRMTETLHGMGVEAMYQEREAQHLADIKALMAKRLVDMRETARWGAETSANVDDATDHEIAADIMSEFVRFDAEDELMQRLAHYDDAKAAEGGEG